MKTIAECLPYGRENAITVEQITALIDSPSVQTTRWQMKRERRTGALILPTDTEKYFLPTKDRDGRRELESFIKSKRRRAARLLSDCEAAEKALLSGEYD